MNPLAYLPELRKKIYSVFFVAGLGIGAAQVAYASTGHGTPDYLKAALAVYAFLGGAVGYQASVNVDPIGDADLPVTEDGVEGADA